MSNQQPIKFGTDGWRGVIAEDFTFVNVRRVAQAYADYITISSGGNNSGVVVGYDHRFHSETFARLICEVLAANGLKTYFTANATPTPAVSYAIQKIGLRGGVMVTASHNPPKFNGLKLKAEYGGSADSHICAQVESYLDKQPAKFITFDEGVRCGMIALHDPRPSHMNAIKRFVDFGAIRKARLSVVVDVMYGVGDSLLESALAGSKCKVASIRTSRDVLFGGLNPEPIRSNLAALCNAVHGARAHIGLATDGDADRIGVVDERGRYVSIQTVFAMLLLHLVRQRSQRGVVVKSSNSTVWVDRICRAYNLECIEVPVGFKHIGSVMRERQNLPLEQQVLMGGEESGGMGFRGHIPERDGLLAGLMLLEMLTTTGKTLSHIARGIEKEFGRRFYDRMDFHYPLEYRQPLLDKLKTSPPSRLLSKTVRELNVSDGVKLISSDDSWLQFRVSGTEPILRIYAEGENAQHTRRLLEFGQKLAHTAL